MRSPSSFNAKEKLDSSVSCWPTVLGPLAHPLDKLVAQNFDSSSQGYGPGRHRRARSPNWAEVLDSLSLASKPRIFNRRRATNNL